MSGPILLVDDDAALRAGVRGILGARPVVEASTKAEGLARFRAVLPSVVLLDVTLPDGDGLELFEAVQCLSPRVPVIVITGQAQVDVVARALRLGAFDFIAKPFEPAALVEAVDRARQGSALDHDDAGAAGLVGESAALAVALDRVRRVAAAPGATALILGESGTGKELAARAIHLFSTRADGPFVTVNCAAVSEALLESELFGYERGAFTGARTEGKRGLFEVADGGSLFLDEVGETSPALQAALLRVLEHRAVRPVGGLVERRVDVRVVAATHRDLVAEVKAGRFREDLFFRLNVVAIRMPALRERVEDIEPLVRHFQRGQRRPASFTPAALAALRAHDWPGNVRELRNVVDRAAILAGDGPVGPEHLELEATAALARGTTDAVVRLRSLRLDEVERQVIDLALAATRGNKRRAAELLGITRTTLYTKLEGGRAEAEP